MAIQILDFDPVAGVIEDDEFVTFDVRTTDTDPLVLVLIAFDLPGLGVCEVAYAGDPASTGAYRDPYAGSTAAVVVDAGFQRYEFRVRRGLRWPDSPNPKIYAVNSVGADAMYDVAETWLIADPPTENPFAPLPAVPPATASPGMCEDIALDQDHFLGVLGRAYPADYVVGLKRVPNGGYEIFQAAAAVGARVSLAMSRLLCCSFLATAGGGTRAVGEVEFYREDLTAGAVTLKAGSVVSTVDGLRFLTTEDAVFGGGDYGPVVAGVQAIAVGYEYNVPGEVVTAASEVLPGEITVLYRARLEPVGEIDTAMRVRQILPTAGGQAACLDGLGADLDIPRVAGEGDDEYRVRIIETPDTVSPDAIRRGLARLLSPFGTVGCFRETGTAKLPGIFFDTDDAFDVDDLNIQRRWRVMLSYAEFRGFFVVGVPRVSVGSLGAFFDTGAACDVDDGKALRFVCAYDVSPAQYSALYRAIHRMLDEKHAGGVGFELYLEDGPCV